MTLLVELAPPDEVLSLRERYRTEMDCQIVLDSWHARKWVDSYLLKIDGQVVGYGLVGGVRANPKDTVTEYYVLPEHRGAALPLFRELLRVSQAKSIEVQSNDRLLTLMLYDYAEKIESNVVLFLDALTTKLSVPGAIFRKVTPQDHEAIKLQKLDADATYCIEFEGTVAATGGLMFHYNPPYGDIYMGVAEAYRKRGLGSFLVQELKRTAYEIGKRPSARCNAANPASRGTLQKAGMLPCGRVLTGTIKGI